MVWTTIPDGDIDPESPIDAPLMAALRDNPIAIAQGLSGAPKILSAAFGDNTLSGVKLQAGTIPAGKHVAGSIAQSDLASASVGRGQLKTATAAGSTNVAGSMPFTYTLTGGTYAWWTCSGYDAGGTSHWAFSAGNVAAGALGLKNITDQFQSFFVDERYVQTSPPYDLGDGIVPLFVTLMLDAGGAIVGSCVAPDPVWVYNGPTDIVPDRYTLDGRAYKRVRMLDGQYASLRLASLDPAARETFLEALAVAPLEEIEITQAIKHNDMPVVPHPWVGNDLTGRTVVMLDPVSRFTERLALLHARGESVRDLLLGGEILIDNVALPRRGPPGVQMVGARFRLTR